MYYSFISSLRLCVFAGDFLWLRRPMSCIVVAQNVGGEKSVWHRHWPRGRAAVKSPALQKVPGTLCPQIGFDKMRTVDYTSL